MIPGFLPLGCLSSSGGFQAPPRCPRVPCGDSTAAEQMPEQRQGAWSREAAAVGRLWRVGSMQPHCHPSGGGVALEKPRGTGTTQPALPSPGQGPPGCRRGTCRLRPAGAPLSLPSHGKGGGGGRGSVGVCSTLRSDPWSWAGDSDPVSFPCPCSNRFA